MTGRKGAKPTPRRRGNAVEIPPGAYPVFGAADAAQLMSALRNPTIAANVARVIESKADEMRAAALAHIDRLNAAAQLADIGAIFEQAHEIRGLAGNAGLAATGRIANGLCRYLDAVGRAKLDAERSLVTLHLEAIARAAHAEDEATRLGDTVANELANLVEKKLAEINLSARR